MSGSRSGRGRRREERAQRALDDACRMGRVPFGKHRVDPLAALAAWGDTRKPGPFTGLAPWMGPWLQPGSPDRVLHAMNQTPVYRGLRTRYLHLFYRFLRSPIGGTGKTGLQGLCAKGAGPSYARAMNWSGCTRVGPGYIRAKNARTSGRCPPGG